MHRGDSARLFVDATLVLKKKLILAEAFQSSDVRVNTEFEGWW